MSTEHLKQRMLEYDWVTPGNINGAIQSEKVISLAVGCCGTITDMCRKRLKILNIGSIMTKLQKAVMKGSSIVLNCHNNE